MKTVLATIFILLSVFATCQMPPRASETSMVLQGKEMSVKKSNLFATLVLYNNDSDTSFPILYFDAFDIITEVDGKETIVKLTKKGDEHQDSHWAIYNLDQGEMVVDFNTSDYNFISTNELILTRNNHEQSSCIITLKGDTLLNDKINYLAYSTFGFYDRAMDAYVPEIFFDKHGNEILRFNSYNLYAEIDSNNFIVQDSNDVISIIDKKGIVLYDDECMGEYRVRRIENSQIRYVATYGICDYDDDSIYLFKQKNGKWKDPISKITTEYFVSYVLPKPHQFQFSSPRGYYVKVDNQGLILNSKGKLIRSVQSTDIPLDYQIDGPFTYLYINSKFAFDLFDSQGEKLLSYQNNFRYDLDKKYEKAGFYVFGNEQEKLVFIYNKKDKEMVTIPRTKFDITTVANLILLYEENL